MRKELYGTAAAPHEDGTEIVYSRISEDAAAAWNFGCEMYGVEVRMGEETAREPHLTASRTAADGLLDKLVRGRVTPVALSDVVGDWLKG